MFYDTVVYDINNDSTYSWQPTGQINADDGNDNLKSNFSLRVACSDYSKQNIH